MRVPGGPATSLCEKHVWTGSLYSPFSRRRCECDDRGRFLSPVRVCIKSPGRRARPDLQLRTVAVATGGSAVPWGPTAAGANRRFFSKFYLDLERKQRSASGEVTTIYQDMTSLGYPRTSELPPSNHRRAVYGRFGSSCVRAAILGRLRNCRRRRMPGCGYGSEKDPPTQIACLASCTD